MNATGCAKWIAVLAVMAIAIAAPAREFLVYFGTYAGPVSRGIYVSRLDADTGKLSPPELAAESPSPCYLAISQNGKYLYAANSVRTFNGQHAGAVSAFGIDSHSGHLKFKNEQSSGGDGPCHVGLNPAGAVLLVANYNAGSVKSFHLDPDGAIGADGTLIQLHGSGPNTNRQSGPHAHFIAADPSGRFALACDLGTDWVTVYEIDAATGALADHAHAAVPPGSGARHLAFSPNGKFVYVVNEMACTVTAFKWDARAGELNSVGTVSALPPGVMAASSDTAAEILAVGGYVYATVRGRDSITVFSADPQTGRLAFVENVSALGQVPRGMGIDPTGRWLIVGNQKTGNVVEFAIDSKTGELSATGQELKIGSPVDVKFVAAN